MDTNFEINQIRTDLSEDELKTIYSFLLSFFLGLMKSVKPSDLVHYIKKNTVFDMRPYFNQLPKQLRPRISKMIQNNKDLINTYMTGDAIINKSKDKRPDLYPILNSQEGRTWIKGFMRYIHNLLFTL